MNDPEKRIADLERDPVGRRFKVTAMSKSWARYSVIGLSGLMFLALGVFIKFNASTNHGGVVGPVVMMSVVFVILGLVLQWVIGGRKVVIDVTADGLTVSKRSGDVFSFRDAEAGQWRKTSGRPYVGRALFLTSGPHRFVLGDMKNPGNANQVPVEGRQVNIQDLDAWTKSTAFDELLTIVSAKRGPQDDPEKCTADVERQLAEQKPGADLPPAQPADAATEGGKGSRRVAFIVRFVAIFCLVAGVNIFGTGALLVYADWSGTPATATIDRCDHETCYAKWSAGGVSQTGPIRLQSRRKLPVGSQVDVHVRGGTAYELQASSAQKLWRTVGGFVALATGVVLFWAAQRKIKTGSWPWSRRL